MYIQVVAYITYVHNYICKKYNKNLQQNIVAKQNKLQKQKQNNLLELKYKYLNVGIVAASDTFNSKLFHNTALQ